MKLVLFVLLIGSSLLKLSTAFLSGVSPHHQATSRNFQPNSIKLCSLQEQSKEGEDDLPFQQWFNPNYSQMDIKKWWVEIRRALLHVGGKGITDTHANSLLEMLNTHNYVRVKVGSCRKTSTELAQALASNYLLCNKTELLLVKEREFMFGKIVIN